MPLDSLVNLRALPALVAKLRIILTPNIRAPVAKPFTFNFESSTLNLEP